MKRQPHLVWVYSADVGYSGKLGKIKPVSLAGVFRLYTNANILPLFTLSKAFDWSPNSTVVDCAAGTWWVCDYHFIVQPRYFANICLMGTLTNPPNLHSQTHNQSLPTCLPRPGTEGNFHQFQFLLETGRVVVSERPSNPIYEVH